MSKWAKTMVVITTEIAELSLWEIADSGLTVGETA